LVQACGRDTVERSELGVEKYSVAAQHEDRAGEVLDRCDWRAGGLSHDGKYFRGFPSGKGHYWCVRAQMHTRRRNIASNLRAPHPYA
jgi:hypothetical protein